MLRWDIVSKINTDKEKWLYMNILSNIARICTKVEQDWISLNSYSYERIHVLEWKEEDMEINRIPSSSADGIRMYKNWRV
jgi:hypothetical protein